MLVDIGFYNYINLEKLVSVKAARSRSEETLDDKAFYEQIKEQGVAIDMTNGKTRRSYVIATDGKVYMSSVRPETLYNRINAALGYTFSVEPGLEEDDEGEQGNFSEQG